MRSMLSGLSAWWLPTNMGKASSKNRQAFDSQKELLKKAVCESLEQNLAVQRHLKNGRGLGDFDAATLQRALRPIEEELRNFDAEAFLRLDRVPHGEEGAQLCEGVAVCAIHDAIDPPNNDDDHSANHAIRYLKVAEQAGHYSIGVFVFPPNVTMPIHDHPGMVVYSRILYGELQRVRLDLLPADDAMDDYGDDDDTTSSSSRRTTRRAYLHPPDLLRAPAVVALFPHDGNLHQFVSGDRGAAVLDVLIPPYDEDDDRDCTYFEILPLEQHEKKDSDDDDDAMDTTRTNTTGALRTVTGGPCRVAPCSADDFTCLGGTYAKWT